MTPSLPKILERVRETHREIAPKLRERVRPFIPDQGIDDGLVATFYAEFHKLFVNFLGGEDLETARPAIRRVSEATAETRLNGDMFLRILFEINQSQKKALLKSAPCDPSELLHIFLEFDRFFNAVMEEFTLARGAHWRKRAREAIKLHSDFFMNLPFPALTGRADMVIRDFNPAVTQTFPTAGSGPKNLRLEDWLVALGVARPRVEHALARLFRQDIIVQQDLEAHCSLTGRPMFLSLTVNLLRDTEHALTGFEAVVQDITRLKYLERQATDQMAQLGAVFYSSPAGLIFVDSNQTIQRINTRACELLGRPSPDQVEGAGMEEFCDWIAIETKDPDPVIESISEALADPESDRAGEFELTSGKTARYSVSPVRDPDGKPVGWLWILADVSELKATERLRRDLTHMIIHDLKNPLTAIRGASFVLKPHLKQAGPVPVEALQLLGRNCDRMMAMIMNLLDVERLEAGKLDLIVEEFQVGRLLDGVMRNQRLAAGGRTLAAEFDEGAQDAVIEGDLNLIERILMNLIGNAIKHTRRDGVITARATIAGPNLLRIAVIDNGAGIPKEHHEKIFEKFGQAGPSKEGRKTNTGLGLTFCKLAIEAHGGGIGVESEPDAGSTFTIEFPLRRGSYGDCESPV